MHTARWTLPTYILAIFLPNCQMVVVHRYCHSYSYGLKQVSLEFHNTMVELFTAADGYLATSDPCLFTKQDGVDISIVAVHVDDLLMFRTSDAEIEKTRSSPCRLLRAFQWQQALSPKRSDYPEYGDPRDGRRQYICVTTCVRNDVV